MKKQIDLNKFSRPNWDESFMFSALWGATRSSCKYLHTGAVIVKDKRIIASGYNGAPPGLENCLDIGCRKEKYHVEFNDKSSGTCRGIHAEINAISQIAREDLKGTTIYTLYFPCSACAKAIVGNSITEVVYSQIYEEPDSLTNELFAQSGVKLRKFNLDIEKQFQRILNVSEQHK
jgi:dCMP deaminase